MKSTLKYFLYVRKSTDEKTRQVMSLESQVNELRKLAEREGLFLLEILEESRSAKLPGRPVFNHMLERIEDGQANGILCWDVDRLYRNPVDEGRTRWLLQRGIIASIRTPSRQFFPDDAGLLMGVEGGRATDYIIRLAKNVKRGVDEKLRRGEWPGNKPLGYVYDRRLRNIVPDPSGAKIVQTIFEEYSGGGGGLDAIGDRMYALGVKSASGHPWSNSAVAHFLSNRLYTGVMVWKGEVFEGKYKPLVSLDLFNRVQAAMKRRSKPRNVRRGHRFPFRGAFHCSCGSSITAQWGKGNGGVYRYYRCSRKIQKCSEPYVQEKVVARQCFEKMAPLGITAEEAVLLREALSSVVAGEAATLDATIKKLERESRGLQEKLDRLTHGYLDELIDEDSYRSAKERLVVEKAEFKQKIARLRKTRANAWFEPTANAINALESIGKHGFVESLDEMSSIVQKIGSNRSISAKTVSFSLAAPFDSIPSLLDSARFARGAAEHTLDPLEVAFPKWCAVQGSNL